MWGVCVCVRVGRTRLRVCEWVTCDPRGPLQVHLQPLRLVELGRGPGESRGLEAGARRVPRALPIPRGGGRQLEVVHPPRLQPQSAVAT